MPLNLDKTEELRKRFKRDEKRIGRTGLTEEGIRQARGRFKQREDIIDFFSVSQGRRDKELLFDRTSGQTVDVPVGSSAILTEINKGGIDDTSGVLEEALAVFKKQPVFLALVAYAFGLVEDVDDFIAERSLALSNAQKHAPEYMKTFNNEMDQADGVFEAMGVILTNPRSMGRIIITQLPNSILPLLAGVTGAGLGTVTLPGIGTVAGMGTGIGIGSALVETGAEIDQLLIEEGVDMTDPQQILEALQDDALMKEIRGKALRKGLSQGAIEGLLAGFGGSILRRLIPSGGIAGKVGRKTGEVGLETFGEGGGETVGQIAGRGKVNVKEALLEAFAGFGQSIGTVGISAAVTKGKKTAAKKIVKEKEELTETEKLERGLEAFKEEEQKEIIEKTAEEVEKTVAKTQEKFKKITEGVPEAEEEVFEFFKEKAREIEKALEPVGPSKKIREKIIKGRIKKLDTEIDAIENQMKLVDDLIIEKQKEGKSTRKTENDLEKLENQRETLDTERDSLILLGMANNLKVTKKKPSKKIEKITERRVQENIIKEEARLILEELKQGHEGRREFRRGEEGELEEIFAVSSTNPPYLFGDLGTVGLIQKGKKLNRTNRRKKRTVINAVEKVVQGKSEPENPLRQRILNLIKERLNEETPRFEPGTGLEDPGRANRFQEITGKEEGETSLEELLETIGAEKIKETPVDLTRTVEIKAEQLAQMERKALAEQKRLINRAVKQAKRAQKKDIKQAVKNVRDLVNASSLDKADKDAVIKQFGTKVEPDFIKKILPKLKAKISTAFINAQRRNLKAKIDNLLSHGNIKPIITAGVKKGKFTAEIQERLEKLREAKKKSGKKPVKIKDFEEEIDIFALEQFENLREIGDPKTGISLSDAEKQLQENIERGDVDPLENLILKKKAFPEGITVEELTRLKEGIEDLISKGRKKAKIRLLNKKLKKEAWSQAVINHVGSQKDVKKFKRTGQSAKGIKTWARSLIADHAFAWNEVVSRALPGKLADVLKLDADIENQKRIRRIWTEKMADITIKAYSLKNSRQAINHLDNQNKIEVLKENFNGKGDNIELSKNEAVYLYSLYQDPILRESLLDQESGGGTTVEGKRIFFDEDFFKTISDVLETTDKQFASELMNLYREFYPVINKEYARRNGINLEFNRFYVPTARETDRQEFGFGDFDGDIEYRRNISPRALKIRRKNFKPIFIRSASAVYNSHISNMAGYIALGEKVELFNAVFGNSEVRNILKLKYGSDMNRIVDEHIQSFVHGPAKAGTWTEKTINFLNRNFAASVLGLKAKIGLTQLISYFAFAEDIPVSAFISGTRDFFRNMPEAVKILGSTEYIRSRGWSPEVDAMRIGESFDNRFLRKLQKKQESMMDYMLILTRGGDRSPIYAGGWAVYKHVLKKTGSHDKAILAFIEKARDTQQSRDVDKLTAGQKRSALIRSLAMFKSAPMAQFRGEVRAVTRWMKSESSKTQMFKGLIIYHVIIPQLYQALANAIIAGEIEEEDQLRALILGSFNGILVIGEAMDAAIRLVQGKPVWGGTHIPMFKWIDAITNLPKDIYEVITEEGDYEETVEGIVDLARDLRPLTGWPVDQANNIRKAIEELDEGELKAPTLRFGGWPPSVVDRIKEDEQSDKIPKWLKTESFPEDF